jgi:flavin reductase (DIM6/NTAB) family NADH-FMN oxidoreductase RutF
MIIDMITSDKIDEGNVLIGHFLGGKLLPFKINGHTEILWQESSLDRMNGVTECLLWFHCSWDYLMPVVDEIERIGHSVLIGSRTCTIIGDQPDELGEVLRISEQGNTRMEAIWNTVVKFIKYINNESSK